MKIVTLRSKQGDIIISELLNDVGKTSLKNPMMLAMGEHGAVFVPYIVLSDEETFEINLNDYVYILDTEKDAANMYKEKVGVATIVTPPSSGKIILP